MSQSGSLANSGGGGGTPITTINGDTGSATGSTILIYANRAGVNSGSTVGFDNSGTTSTLSVTDGVANTLVGKFSGNAALTGIANTGLGQAALASLTSGVQNTAMGNGALGANTSASANSAFGYLAGGSLSTGVNNTAVGYGALGNCISGNSNNAFGFLALQVCTGSSNLAMGNSALQALTTGTFNVALGETAGFAYTTETGNIAIQNVGVAGDAGVIRIGNGTFTKAFISGIAGVQISNAQTVSIDTATGQLGTSVAPEFTVQRTLTSSEIKNLNGTPIAIIPAQGAGKVVVITSAIAKYTYGGTNVFVAAAAQSISLYYGTANNAYAAAFVSNAAIIGTASAYSFYPVASTTLNPLAISAFENVAINAYNPVAVEISGNAANNNTITFVVKYYVVTI